MLFIFICRYFKRVNQRLHYVSQQSHQYWWKSVKCSRSVTHLSKNSRWWMPPSLILSLHHFRCQKRVLFIRGSYQYWFLVKIGFNGWEMAETTGSSRWRMPPSWHSILFICVNYIGISRWKFITKMYVCGCNSTFKGCLISEASMLSDALPLSYY